MENMRASNIIIKRAVGAGEGNPPGEVEMESEPMIYCVRNLSVSDLEAQPVALSRVEDLLRGASSKRSEHWLEATNPGREKGASRDSSRVRNRVYVDIDGGAFQSYGCPPQSDEWLETTQREIIRCFERNITEPFSLMTASARLPNHDIKLSFRITYTHLYGTKAEVEAYVFRVLLPLYKKWLADIIPTDAKQNQYVKRANPISGRKEDAPPDYPHLTIDRSVYDVGRKMRMWNCVKDNKPENVGRPNVLVRGSVLDTLITYIPAGAEHLKLPDDDDVPTPLPSFAAATRSAPRQPEEMSVSDSTTVCDPSLDEPTQEQRFHTVREVLDNLADWRADDYDCWIRVGFICFNIGKQIA